MNHYEIYSDNWKDKRSEGLDFVNIDALCTASSYARYSKTISQDSENHRIRNEIMPKFA